MITWDDFTKVDIRCGTILSVAAFPKAKKPAYQLSIDFGPLGIRKSSAQITDHYSIENLVGKQIIAVVNFPPKQIANFISECLVLGVYNEAHEVILLHPSLPVSNGQPIG
jgi:tRNA-binding protein